MYVLMCCSALNIAALCGGGGWCFYQYELFSFYTALLRVLYWPNITFQAWNMFEKLMETFKHTLSSCHVEEEPCVKIGSCRSRVHPNLSYLQALSRLRREGGENWSYSVTPQGILNTHKTLWSLGTRVGKSDLPGSMTATFLPIWVIWVAAAGLCGSDTLWVGFLFTQVSCYCPQHLPHQPAQPHSITFGRAWLVCSISVVSELGTELLSLGKQQASHFGLLFLV